MSAVGNNACLLAFAIRVRALLSSSPLLAVLRPRSYPVGRQRCLPPCPLCPPSAVFCPCPVLAVLASRLVGVGLGQVGPSPCLSAFVLPLQVIPPRVLAVLRQLAHAPVFGAESSPPQKPPYRSAPPWAVCSPSPSLLVSWVGGLPPVGLVLPPPAGAGRTIVYISYPHLYGSCGGMFPPIPLPNTI